MACVCRCGARSTTTSRSERLPTIVTFTVSQLVNQIRNSLRAEDQLQDLWLEGEISQFTQATSGHCYFKLKDSGASLDCVMWRAQAVLLRKLPNHGDQVLVHGKVDVFPQQGKLQLYVDLLQPSGLGQLNLAFEALKQRLAAEGLFDAARKRPLPARPQRIGIVTSADAAALRDILRTLNARYPLVDVVLASCLVQGPEAPAQIDSAIQAINRWAAAVEPVDVLIVARGGGSLEELGAFNDERVARALAASQVPTIAGVGHETDFTIADFVADVRAPTPTAAATLAVPDQRELRDQLEGTRRYLVDRCLGQLRSARRDVQAHRRLLTRVSPQAIVAMHRQRIDELTWRAGVRLRARLDVLHERVAAEQNRIQALNPRHVLARGYAIVQQSASGAVVTGVQQVSSGDRLHVTVADGSFAVEVTADEL